MALNNQHMTRSNGFGNAGRKKKKEVEAGTAEQYMEQRDKNKRPMERRLWERQTMAWFAPVHTVFDRLEEIKVAGKTVAYGSNESYGDGSYVGAVRSFNSVTPTALKLIAASRAEGGDRHTLTKLAEAVVDAQQDDEADVAKYASIKDPEDKRKALQRARKKRWKQNKSAHALLHTDVRVRSSSKWWLRALFGKEGRYPMGLGRAREELE